jgi:elongator complex protein 3
LQWVTSQDRIAGFLRLSLPFDAEEAMIREVHVYGRVAGIHEPSRGGAQHAGLGRQLVEEACARASAAGYHAINVISSVGTRNYYRSLGFVDGELYQRRSLA